VTASISATDVGVPLTGVVSSTDSFIDMTNITSAFLVISGVGAKTAIVVSSTETHATLRWFYDGSLAAGTYQCWWRLLFPGGERTAPTGTSLTLHVLSVS